MVVNDFINDETKILYDILISHGVITYECDDYAEVEFDGKTYSITVRQINEDTIMVTQIKEVI